MDAVKRTKTKTVAAVGTAGIALSVAFILLLSPSGLSAACDPEAFTVNGVLDLEGDLACEAGAGGLPATGSENLQLAGIALALIVVGFASLYIARRQRPSAT